MCSYLCYHHIGARSSSSSRHVGCVVADSAPRRYRRYHGLAIWKQRGEWRDWKSEWLETLKKSRNEVIQRYVEHISAYWMGKRSDWKLRWETIDMGSLILRLGVRNAALFRKEMHL